MDRQVDVIYSCCALINFMILQGERFDDDVNLEGMQPEPGAMENGRAGGGDGNEGRGERPAAGAHRRRDEIARAMWDQYRGYLNDRRER